MKTILKFSLSLLLGTFCTFSLLKNTDSTTKSVVAESTDYEVVQADVSRFRTLLKSNDQTTLSIDETAGTVTTNGGWDSGFASTSQFDTGAPSYYLKAHCSNPEQGDCNEGECGFNIYFDNINNINFYLKWDKSNWAGSICEAVFLGHIDGVAENAYESAILPYGAFSLRGIFTDCWTDFGGWTTGKDRDSGTGINLRTEGSTILLNKGFDMTLYVDRTTYKNRLVDVVQIQVDAFAGDGTTPQTFYTPKYALDAFTAPKGVESPFACIRPEIGFWNYNVGNVTYSNIEFGSCRETNPQTANFSIVGESPVQASVDSDAGIITYENNNFNSGFYLADSLRLTSPRTDFLASVSGSVGDVEDTSIGFVLYYDENNYATFYLRWNGSAGTIDGCHVLITVDGVDQNAYQGARKPWDNPNVTSGAKGFQTIAEIKDIWSDNDGFITDYEYPCGIDANFNHFRSESALTLETGFQMGLIRRRTVFLSKTIDEVQLVIAGVGKDGKEHTWYTPSWCLDAFTYPNGSESPSEFLNDIPLLGFYGYQTGEVTISNCSLNGSKVWPRDKATLVFGSHEEEGWTLSGSDRGRNWEVSETGLSESWDELYADTHKDEVHAFQPCNQANGFLSGTLVVSSSVGSAAYMGIYPYYLDAENYLLASIVYEGEKPHFVVRGKLDGVDVGGVEKPLDIALSLGVEEPVQLEIGIVENEIDFYFGETPKPTYSLSLERDHFAERNLTNAQAGFGFYNANGTVSDIALNGTERIRPYVPSEEQKPVIYEYGTRAVSGFVGYAFSLPTFVAFNYLKEAIATTITVEKDDGTLVATLAEGASSFTVDETGTYRVTVNASDEWGHSAEKISYLVNFVTYSGPGEVAPKEILWQTVVVLSFFGGVLLITAACAVILARKNKKEALRAAELNRKNQKKNAADEEEE